MSNRKPQKPSPSPPLPLTQSPSQFTHSLAKLAITKILRSIGFKSSKSSALETLTRITTLFLHSFSQSAAINASSNNRTHSNIFDILHVLHNLSLSFTFSGASTIFTPKTLHYFIDTIDERPTRLPPRHVSNSVSSVLFSGNFDFLSNNNNNRGPEIPTWLPQFPEIGDDKGVNLKGKEKEVLWEERRIEYVPSPAAKPEKVKKEGVGVLLGRRERVKFKLVGKKRDLKVGGLDELELRNGVCRGGKRVCLIKRGSNSNNNTSLICQDDDDDKGFTNGL